MHMKTRAFVKNKEIRFGSLIAQQRFFENTEGKNIIISLDDAPTAEKRRFFEGCLVPVTFYTHKNTDWDSFVDAREALKLEFLPRKFRTDLAGKQFVIPRSTLELSNRKFGEMIESIVQWLTENQMVPADAIDPENYKAWRDSAPSVGEVYPPLARLKEVYDREKAI